jgi:hypothetical protein
LTNSIYLMSYASINIKCRVLFTDPSNVELVLKRALLGGNGSANTDGKNFSSLSTLWKFLTASLAHFIFAQSTEDTHFQ